MSVSVSIIGLGKMGENHLRILNLMKNVEIKFIFDFKFFEKIIN